MSEEKQKMIAGEHYRPGDDDVTGDRCGPDIWFTVITTPRLMKNQNASILAEFWDKAKGLILSPASAATTATIFIWAKLLR
jgi:maltose O-acetyltransferase